MLINDDKLVFTLNKNIGFEKFSDNTVFKELFLFFYNFSFGCRLFSLLKSLLRYILEFRVLWNICL